MSKILFILAAVCFALAAFKATVQIGATSIDFTAAGFCLLTIALWLV